MRNKFFEASNSEDRKHSLNPAKPLTMNPSPISYFEAEFNQLLKHTALAEWIQARPIWKLYPVLLTRKGTVYFSNTIHTEGKEPYDIPMDIHPGRYKYVNCTPWQIALMNEEWEIAEEMAEPMDEEEKRNQFFEVFPNGEIESRLDFAKAKALLTEVFNSVVVDTNINRCNRNEMYHFTRFYLLKLYNYVKPAPEHKTGLVFDKNIYLAALELYKERSGEFMNEDQRSFWCIRVEEYLAGLSGTSLLSLHSKGICSRGFEEIFENIYQSRVDEYAEVIDRLNHQYSGCTMQTGSIHPFRRDVNSIPGFHFFVGMSGGQLEKGGRGGILDTRIKILQKFCEKQDQKMTDFAQQFELSSLKQNF